MLIRKRPTTVDAAIAPLLQAVSDLEHVVDERNASLARGSALMSSLETLMETDQIELTRAEAVATMIKAITSPDLTPAAEGVAAAV